MTDHSPDESRREDQPIEGQGGPWQSESSSSASEAGEVSGSGQPEAGTAPHGPGWSGAHPGDQQGGPQGTGHPGAYQGAPQDSGYQGGAPQGSTYQGGYPHPVQQQYAGQQQYPGQQYAGQQQYPGQQPGPYDATQPQAYPGAEGWQQPGYAPMPPVGTSQQPGGRRKSGRAGLFTVVGVLALVAVLVSGGAGGYVGYRLGSDSASTGTSSLNAPRPARSASDAPAGSVQAVAQKVLPSVVQLQTSSMRGSGEGSGIVLSEDGYILTNNHVVEGAEAGARVTAQFHDQRSAPVKVVGTDPKSDLAVVKADITGLTPAELGRSDDLKVGSQVVAIGSPFGLSGTVTSGIVSAKNRPVRAGGESGSQASVMNAIQTDAAINPGNSGGPLVDKDGRVVGINSAIYSPGSGMTQQQAGSVGLGFAIPIDQAKQIAQQLMQDGSVTHANLGVTITPARGGGAQIVEVHDGAPASKAGVKRGEVITKLGNRTIEDPDTLIAAVRSHNPGDTVKLTLSRGGGDTRTVEVTLGGSQ
ncbi:trypsin-like peptidase domain-containing protein [Salinifilum ghardaiensis]